MAHHKSAQFKNQELELDGQTFEDCTFDDCVVVYRGGEPPRLIGNTFRATRWRFDDAATRTIMFLRAMYGATGGARAVAEEAIETIKGGKQPPTPSVH